MLRGNAEDFLIPETPPPARTAANTPWLTVGECARLWRKKKETIVKWIKKGLLPAEKDPGGWQWQIPWHGVRLLYGSGLSNANYRRVNNLTAADRAIEQAVNREVYSRVA